MADLMLTPGLPTQLPELSQKDLRIITQGKRDQYKNILVKMSGGGRRQITQNEILLLQSLPRLKENETTKSFKSRVKTWEGVTGIKNIHQNKLGIPTNESRVIRGDIRWDSGLKIPQDYTADPDWNDTIKDLEAQKVYNPNTYSHRQEVQPLNVEELSKKEQKKFKNVPAPTPQKDASTDGKEAVGLEGQLQAQLKAFKPTTIQKQLLKAGFTKGELIKKMNAHEKWKADRRR